MPVRTRLRLSCLAAWAVVASTAAATAAELLMFEDAGCGYCRRWHEEIGPGYPKTTEGQRAPLRRVDILAGAPAGIQLDRRITVTPTFVLVEDGREVGRLTGYIGAEFFYELLGDVMSRLPQGAARSAAEGKAVQ